MLWSSPEDGQSCKHQFFSEIIKEFSHGVTANSFYLYTHVQTHTIKYKNWKHNQHVGLGLSAIQSNPDSQSCKSRKVSLLSQPDHSFPPYLCLLIQWQDENEAFPGMDLAYEFHSNQSNDPSNVLLHCLGHWRLTPNFHDVCFLPTITVSLEFGVAIKTRS